MLHQSLHGATAPQVGKGEGWVWGSRIDNEMGQSIWRVRDHGGNTSDMEPTMVRLSSGGKTDVSEERCAPDRDAMCCTWVGWRLVG